MYEQSRTHIVVDMLNDFISGSMACQNAENAMTHSINYINLHPADKVVYVCDTHPENHCSFTGHGGQWPPHCVINTSGQEIHLSYYTRVNDPNMRPHLMRIFRKGSSAMKEEYSGFNAVRSDGKSLTSILTKQVIVSGIATEYCVFETVKDLVEAEYDVQVLLEGLAYVNQKDHRAAIENMKSLGVKFV
ncbi:MAG: isochorismatase family protein [Bacteroidales bacterium]|nr:isochorismatase family protein [Bacteroidales bacterium]MDD4030546.1 isochorismatase family protein [Bacteroidales bacterium]MDD4434883.1 isochorismatase family protein [Bacteroidales bacterium]MDD5733209.1 isochorismatase family protein [Bacteroidales bacterium]